jgi:hypothetical protein
LETYRPTEPAGLDPDVSLALKAVSVPSQLGRVAELIGRFNTFKVAQAFGGGRLSIPRHITPGHRLAELVGLEAAKALVREWGGGGIDIPRWQVLLRAIQALKLLRAHEAGESQERLARNHRMTSRSVRKLLDQARHIRARHGG